MKCALILLAVLATPCLADPRPLSDVEKTRFAAVGSLNVQGHQACTAALISETEAVTAAHCVINRKTGLRMAPGLYDLVLGQGADGSGTRRGVRATAFLPGYLDPATGLTFDVALLLLDDPVTDIAPLIVQDWPDPVGEFVDIVGYEKGRSKDAMLREGCTALQQAQGAVVESCDVKVPPEKAPPLVAVVSSRAQGVGFVVPLAPRLAELRAVLAAE
jgi:protease YdgD